MREFTVFDIETTGRVPWAAKLLRAGIGSTSHRRPAARAKMRALLKQPGVVVEHTMFDARWALLDHATLGPKTDVHDTRVMAWLLDEAQPLKLEDLMYRYLGEEITKPIVQRQNVPVWSTEVWPVGDARAYVPLDEVPDDVMDEYNAGDLDETARLYETLRDELVGEDLWDLFLAKEVPLGRALVLMEAAGLPYNSELSEELRGNVRLEADALQEKLVAAAGLPINVGSTSQLAAYLFAPAGSRVELKGSLSIDDEDKALMKDVPKEERVAWFNASEYMPEGFEVTSVGRDYVRGVWVGEGRGLVAAEHGFGSSTHWKQKAMEHKNPSTSSVSLVLANPDDAWVGDLVYWRELDKLEGSFLAKFPLYVHEGRLHGTVNRCGTVTGRFSSAEPNLQNIPAHGTYGKLVRALFGGELALGDYAQLEQRVAAHYSQDPKLLEAYRDNVDLYGLAAATLFGGEPTKKHERRGLMKTGMLALQYGARPGKLVQLIKIDGHGDATLAEATELVAQLYGVFTTFFDWRDDVIESAIRHGYVRTLSGRLRRLDFPPRWLEFFQARRAADRGDKAAAKRARFMRGKYTEEQLSAGFSMERQAVNALCQGGAADIVGGAMVAVEEQMPDEVRTLVQVHDEIVWERLAGWGDDSLAKLRELCETGHGYALDVPLVFEAIEATSWADKSGGVTNVSNLFSERMKRGREAALDANSEGLQSRKASGLARAQQKALVDGALGNGGKRPARRAKR